MAKRLENVRSRCNNAFGCSYWIRFGYSKYNKYKNNKKLKQNLPLIIDAGLGQASDATIAMELGCDGVLVNTAIAKAKKPFEMALAFKECCDCWKTIIS